MTNIGPEPRYYSPKFGGLGWTLIYTCTSCKKRYTVDRVFDSQGWCRSCRGYYVAVSRCLDCDRPFWAKVCPDTGTQYVAVCYSCHKGYSQVSVDLGTGIVSNTLEHRLDNFNKEK